MDTKVCAQPVEEDEEEGSEYEYEYEYETESDEEENMDEGNTLETEEASGTIKIHPVVIEQIECSPEEMIDDSTNQDIFEKPSLTREQIRAMKPKLPAYITSPEPCEFCDDPCTWIAWMEAQVNTERDRRMKQILSQNSEDPEVNPEEEICQPPSMEFDQSPVVKDGTNLVETKGEEEICPEPIAVDSMLEEETPEISGQNCSIKSKRFTDTVATPANVDAMDYKQKEQDSASEWEYETDEEHEEAKNVDEKIVIDVVEHENVETIEQETTNFVMAEDCNNNRKMSNNNEETSMDVEISQEQIDITDESKDSFTDKLQPPIYKKQMSCPAISLVPDDIQKKLDFIRKKKASHGQLGGEIPTISPNNSILDEETQRKLSFIRQKKILAAQENVSENSNGALVRQMSTPENCPRPQSMNSDSSLDDMLARIKILREERKQILQDMSAIKNAFETNEPHDKVEMSIPDDGIASGNNTPNSEMFHSFHNDDTSGKTSPTISASMLSRHSRRSIDSGIGSKSMCSMQDGSPTAEIEAHAGKSTGSAHLGNDSCGKRKINRDKVSSEGEFFCFICGDNLGKLTKGAIMHMGLEDGDPVCADALYLTDDSKEKIRQIATTKMFTFEAKYDLLETLELETWDIDYEIPAGDVMKKVDAFLLDVEEQKVRDKEKFDAMRSGAIDDVFNEEFADLINSKYSSDTLENEYMDEPNTSDQYSNVPAVPAVPSYRRELETRSLSPSTVPAPPPPPPPAIQSSIKSNPALSNALLASIQQGGTNLRHAETIDKSEIKVGQVIHRHIAPIVFNRDIRSLVKDIAKDDHKKRLKKVKTNDKSQPYIPDDVEIYFYAGPNSQKSAPPPPLSKIKFTSSSLKRANIGMENGVSPVYLAAQEGHLDVLKYLVAQGGDVNCRAQDGMAPIHAAAQMGNLSCIQWMINEQSVDINLKDGDEATPLHFAASRGHVQVVRWLVGEGAKLAEDKFGKTPINDATENNQSDVLVVLLRYARTQEAEHKLVQNPDKCEPFYLHTPLAEKEDDESSSHEYEAISEDEPEDSRTRFVPAGAPPPPPLPPPDLLTPAVNRRGPEVNKGGSINSLSSLSSKEEENCNVLKPSALTKGKKRKNIPKEESAPPEDDRPVIPGAHMVLPFLPPRFTSFKGEGDSLIKPSEYLKSLSKPQSLDEIQVEDSEPESGFDSQESSSPSSSSNSPNHPSPSSSSSSNHSSSNTALPSKTEQRVPPPPPPPPMARVPPPPPPPPPHPVLTSTVSAPPSLPAQKDKEERGGNPSSMAISMKDLQSVQLKKTESRPGLDRTHSVPLQKLIPLPGEFGSPKGDLIAELKLSHNVGGVSKLKSEQAKAQEEVEKEQYRKFLGQFTAENFLKKIPVTDPLGNEIPRWKREMMAKKAADKAKADALEERARLDEARRLSSIPAWKRQLLDKKGDDAKRVLKVKHDRELERKKKLICRL